MEELEKPIETEQPEVPIFYTQVCSYLDRQAWALLFFRTDDYLPWAYQYACEKKDILRITQLDVIRAANEYVTQLIIAHMGKLGITGPELVSRSVQHHYAHSVYRFMSEYLMYIKNNYPRPATPPKLPRPERKKWLGLF
jgi:hypothetical protein